MEPVSSGYALNVSHFWNNSEKPLQIMKSHLGISLLWQLARLHTPDRKGQGNLLS